MNLRAAALVLALGAAGGALATCGGQPVTGISETRARGCPEVTLAKSCVRDLRWKDVEPIFIKSCVPCHYGGADPDSPWPLYTFSSVIAWDDELRLHLLECSQPPADSPFPFSAQDRYDLIDWLRCDHPE